MNANTLRHAAIAADHDFHTALIAQFGARTASDARYWHNRSYSPVTLAAEQRKLAADAAWWQAVNELHRAGAV